MFDVGNNSSSAGRRLRAATPVASRPVTGPGVSASANR